MNKDDMIFKIATIINAENALPANNIFDKAEKIYSLIDAEGGKDELGWMDKFHNDFKQFGAFTRGEVIDWIKENLVIVCNESAGAPSIGKDGYKELFEKFCNEAYEGSGINIPYTSIEYFEKILSKSAAAPSMEENKTYTTDEVWKMYSEDKNYGSKSYSQFAKENGWVMIKAASIKGDACTEDKHIPGCRCDAKEDAIEQRISKCRFCGATVMDGGNIFYNCHINTR